MNYLHIVAIRLDNFLRYANFYININPYRGIHR
jgi:hypothetical protein